ncbi:MAG: recombinase family protein [Gemmatimonadota bacterium]|nr:recombinase family protein [Gemmatimonadota bacterium]
MEKAVCYIRVGPQDDTGLTLEDQVSAVERYCEQNELDNMMVIRDESIAGTVPLEDRLGGSDLDSITERTGVTHIVCIKLDRLFRNAIDADQHISLWTENNVVLHVVNMGGMPIRTDDTVGRCMIAGFSEMERNMASERTRSAIAMKKANRFVYGTTPYGFDQVGNQLTPNDKEQATIQSVLEWRRKGWSLRRIANKLNEDEIPTKRAPTSEKSTKWYASTVRYLLANSLYSDQPSLDSPQNYEESQDDSGGR